LIRHRSLGLINQTNRYSFDADDIQLIESLVEQLTAVVEIDSLHRHQTQTEHLHRNLKITAEVQTSFLPGDLPNVPGYEIATTLISASKIGGDFLRYLYR
jgi:serine phosphatase RsbU (regulator of sigma subunit)